MSRLLITTVLFLFALLIILVARWKEISWLWKSLWGKIVFIALLMTFVFFSTYDIASKAESSDPSTQVVLDSLNIKDEKTKELFVQLTTKIDSLNSASLDHYKKHGPSPGFDTVSFDRTPGPLVLSNTPKLVYLSDHDVAVIIKLGNVTNKPAYIGGFKSFLVDIDDSLKQEDADLYSREAITKAKNRSFVRIGKSKELPSYFDDYQIIVFIHSSENVRAKEKYSLLYITSNLNDYCDSQSLTLIWDSDGMTQRKAFKELICTYLNKHYPLK